MYKHMIIYRYAENVIRYTLLSPSLSFLVLSTQHALASDLYMDLALLFRHRTYRNKRRA